VGKKFVRAHLLANYTQEEGEVVLLGKTCQLERVVEAYVNKTLYPRFSQCAEELFSAFFVKPIV
jgi:hypothetical protein